MSILVKITERAGKFRTAFTVVCVMALIASVYLGTTTYYEAKSLPTANPRQNEYGVWELTFNMKVTAFVHYYDQVYIAHPNQEDWSENLLDEPIKSGKGHAITFPIADPSDVFYDVKAVRSDGLEMTFHNFDLSDTSYIFPLYDENQVIRDPEGRVTYNTDNMHENKELPK